MWESLYQVPGTCSSTLPWNLVQGNHDWRANPTAQIEYSTRTINSTSNRGGWHIDSFFYEKYHDNITVGLDPATSQPITVSAVYLYIDTNLLAYGYDGEPDDSSGKNCDTIETYISIFTQ